MCLPGKKVLARVDCAPSGSDRKAATVWATDPRTGRTVEGEAVPRADGFGYFSLPGFTGDPSFPEVFVKMTDGTAVPGGSF